MSVRPATHAGTWYSSNASKLTSQLQQYLLHSQVVPRARIIISPHAGYTYCGSTMGKAYGTLDLQNIKRIFILGPSHHVYFRNKALVSQFDEVETPLGNILVDTEVAKQLIKHEEFEPMDAEMDCDEHSLEMQYSMLYETLRLRQIDIKQARIVPIMISHNSTRIDYALGKTLSKYASDESSAFIISSDFCHWGRRFNYTGYVGDKSEIEEALKDDTEIESLTARSKLSRHQIPIWKSIELLDKFAMELLSQSEPHDKYELWKQYLEVTGNTICGEKPIGVILCALSYLKAVNGKFSWPGYSQSSQVSNVMESSVSYAAGFCSI